MKEETKTVRIEVPLIAVIRKYSDGSISDGIWAMESVIQGKRGVKLEWGETFGEPGATVVSGLGVVPTGAPHDEAYWERVREEVRKGIEAAIGRD